MNQGIMINLLNLGEASAFYHLNPRGWESFGFPIKDGKLNCIPV